MKMKIKLLLSLILPLVVTPAIVTSACSWNLKPPVNTPDEPSKSGSGSTTSSSADKLAAFKTNIAAIDNDVLTNWESIVTTHRDELAKLLSGNLETDVEYASSYLGGGKLLDTDEYIKSIGDSELGESDPDDQNAINSLKFALNTLFIDFFNASISYWYAVFAIIPHKYFGDTNIDHWAIILWAGEKYNDITITKLHEWNNLQMSKKQPYLTQVDNDKKKLNEYCKMGATNDNQILLLKKANSLLPELLNKKAETYLGETLNDADITYYKAQKEYVLFECKWFNILNVNNKISAYYLK